MKRERVMGDKGVIIESIDCLFRILLVLYLFVAIPSGPFQIAVAGVENKTERCANPMRRIEYVLPYYRLGCWLFNEAGK